ncbi:MAG: integrase family protein [candidate division NC10 bacterium]|nr:integrase family protein [candidate division NC10 bacterium]
MLEYWYRERRTLVDFRRGPLGPYFDGFAAYLKARGYTSSPAHGILSKCCQFNAFLIERGISRCREVPHAFAEPFLEAYHGPALAVGSQYVPSGGTRRALNHLFAYLIQERGLKRPKARRIIKPYTWILEPYLRYLERERQLSARNITYIHRPLLERFLDGLASKACRAQFKKLKPTVVESCVRVHFRTSTAHPGTLATVLRAFFRYCADRRYARADFSGLIPTMRRYHHTALPKGMEDNALEAMLRAIPTDTELGARDYAILVLMMAYGMRGISVAELLLNDIDWAHSRIRVRAQKGGKEVMLPLLEPVGEAIVRYLKHRRAGTPFREVFLSVCAPFRPLSAQAISPLVQRRLKNAGVKTPGSGARTLRHSWAIRALAHDSPIKSIADVLGHRYIDTTFIYAKADLNSLREVALPWPGKR